MYLKLRAGVSALFLLFSLAIGISASITPMTAFSGGTFEALKLQDPQGRFSQENLKVEDGKALRLPLGGVGIRSIEFDERRQAFVIITGAAANNEKADFKLWEWNGDASSPTLRETDTFDRKLKPEGITRFSNGQRDFTFIVFDTSGYIAMDK